MMMQALTPPASFFFLRDFSGRESSQRSFKMFYSRWKAYFFYRKWMLLVCVNRMVPATESRRSAPAALTPEKALALANQGLCRESISALKRALTSQLGPAERKRAAVVGVRCSLAIDDRDSTLDFIRLSA